MAMPRPSGMKIVQYVLYCSLTMLLLSLTIGIKAEAAGNAATEMRMDNFKTREMNDDGTVAWELHGQNAVVDGPFAEITGVVLTVRLEDNSEAVIKSPRCRLDRNRQLVTSDDVIHVESKSLKLDGRGYVFYFEPRLLIIHHDGHMVITEDTKQLLDGPKRTDENADDKPKQEQE